MSVTSVTDSLPSFQDISDAAARLRDHLVHTPLLSSPLLDDRLGLRLLVKAEPLQRTGSFKFRGAFNRIALIPEGVRSSGVVAFSSGNHAQGVAAAARIFGIPATIVMPSDAPAIKIGNTRAWGAQVVLYDRHTENREAIGARISEETGATLVKPYDDRDVIAGQGTIGIEMAEQAAELGCGIDTVIVPCSGGGLIAGIATAMATVSPASRLYSAEPEDCDDMSRSLVAGHRVSNPPESSGFCDALLAPTPGELTFEIARRHLAGGVAASDTEVCRAMAVAFEHFKLVVEPGGAVALAALLAGRLDLAGRTVAVVCSGGNVDPAIYANSIARAAATT